jgi:hypothetical protein
MKETLNFNREVTRCKNPFSKLWKKNDRMDSDSDDDLLNYGPSGLSQTSLTPDNKEQLDETQNQNETTNVTMNLLESNKIDQRGGLFFQLSSIFRYY